MFKLQKHKKCPLNLKKNMLPDKTGLRSAASESGRYVGKVIMIGK